MIFLHRGPCACGQERSDEGGAIKGVICVGMQNVKPLLQFGT